MKRKEFVNGFASSYPNRLIASMSTSSLLARGANPFWNSLVSFIDLHMVYKAAVCLCDLGIRESFASVHISFVALKKTFCYWLSFKAMHWSNIISKFGTFPCREFNLVISWTFISFFFSLVYISHFWPNWVNHGFIMPNGRKTCWHARFFNLKFLTPFFRGQSFGLSPIWVQEVYKSGVSNLGS